MGDMYTDVERSIQQTILAGIAARGYSYPFFNNMISKKDIKDQHAGMGLMKTSDTFQPANGGGTKAQIKTPNVVNGVRTGFTVQEWPDPFDLLYQFTVIADLLPDARKLDQLIRDVLKPKGRLLLWDSTANGGVGAFTTSYCNYQYAGYINRDVPENSTYWRITNLRFEAFNYPETTTQQGVISEIDFSFLLGTVAQQANVVTPPAPGVQEVPPSVIPFSKSVFPTGVRDGVNRVFTLGDAPAGLVFAYLNGGFIPARDVAGLVNWTLVGNVFTAVSFVVKATDELVLVY